MPDLAHPAWPFRFTAGPDGSVGFATVEQDSDLDLAASAAVITCTRRGHRDDASAFGVTPLNFRQGRIDLDRYESELAASDARLNPRAVQTGDLAQATIANVRVQVTGGNP